MMNIVRSDVLLLLSVVHKSQVNIIIRFVLLTFEFPIFGCGTRRFHCLTNVNIFSLFRQNVL